MFKGLKGEERSNSLRFVNLVELAKALAISTYNLSLVFPCCIGSQGDPRLPNEPCPIAFRTSITQQKTQHSSMKLQLSKVNFQRSIKMESCLAMKLCKAGCDYMSLREKRIGKAVPTRATRAAPPIKYGVLSADTSPTTATTVNARFLFFSVLFHDLDPAKGLPTNVGCFSVSAESIVRGEEDIEAIYTKSVCFNFWGRKGLSWEYK